MLDYLPNEMITYIFSYFTIDELIRGRMISKKYREIIITHQLILAKNPFMNKKYLKILCLRSELIENHWEKIPVNHLLKLPEYFAKYGSSAGFNFCFQILKSMRITDYVTLWCNNGHNNDLINHPIAVGIIDKLQSHVFDDTVFDFIDFGCACKYGKAKEWLQYKYNIDRLCKEDIRLLIESDLWKEYITKALSGKFEQENVWRYLSKLINTERLDIIEYILCNVESCFKYFVLKTVNKKVIYSCIEFVDGESIDFLFNEGRMDLIQILTNAVPLHLVSLLQIYLEQKMYHKAIEVIDQVYEISKSKKIDFPIDAIAINIIKYEGNLATLLYLYNCFYDQFPKNEVLNVCKTAFSTEDIRTFSRMGGILMYSDISGNIFDPDHPTLEFIYRSKHPELANRIDQTILNNCDIKILEINTIKWLCEQIGKDKLEEHIMDDLVKYHLSEGNYDKAKKLIEMGFSVDKSSYGLGIPSDTRKSISMIQNEIKEMLHFLRYHSQPLPSFIIYTYSYYYHYQYSLDC